MPIYEYECRKCGKVFEELQGFNDPPLKKCRICKGKLEKLISLSSFQLTGTGWYATDYAKGPGIPAQAKDQDNPAVESSSDSSSTSDSKATVAESGPSSASDTFKAIEKETKKAKSKKKK
jgi:putative FmdB family regulatory protein